MARESVKVVKNSDKQALSDYLWGKDILDLLNIDPDFHFDVDESFVKFENHFSIELIPFPQVLNILILYT